MSLKNETLAPVRTDTDAYGFVLDLQSSPSVDASWKLFIKKITATLPPQTARLVYKFGIFFKILEFDAGKIVSRDIDSYRFMATDNEFAQSFKENRLVVFKQMSANFLQVELDFSSRPVSESDENRLLTLGRLFVNQLSMVLQLENAEFHSIKDDITLAYNQRYLKTFTRNEIERCKRYPPSYFAVVFFDLDNLKAVNEAHGHLVGTEVLKEVSSLLRNQVRKIDLLSRFGGDEFVIILLKTDADGANEICSRIKERMEATAFLSGKQLDIKMTGCFGISSFPRDGDTVDTLLKKADAAMYDVKRTGKNGIKIYEGD